MIKVLPNYDFIRSTVSRFLVPHIEYHHACRNNPINYRRRLWKLFITSFNFDLS